MAVSQVRQNFHEDSENGINKQINMELYASYVYMSMVSILNLTMPYVFNRGCRKFLIKIPTSGSTVPNQYYGLVLGRNILIA